MQRGGGPVPAAGGRARTCGGGEGPYLRRGGGPVPAAGGRARTCGGGEGPYLRRGGGPVPAAGGRGGVPWDMMHIHRPSDLGACTAPDTDCGGDRGPLFHWGHCALCPGTPGPHPLAHCKAAGGVAHGPEPSDEGHMTAG